MRIPFQWSALLASFLSLAGPAIASESTLPPYTQAYEPQTVDERGMWMEADEYERRLSQSPLLVKDGKLEGYVHRVLCETVGKGRCGSVRVYLLEIPAFNAMMMPNGVMIVWSGLLLRVRSEAELGAVLGHEFAHFELRHTLEGFKNARGTTDALAWVHVLGGMTNTDTRSAETSLIGSIFRYNRGQEQQADLLGLDYLAVSEYPSSAAADIWRNIMAEADATAAGRKLKAKHRYSAGFFDTHPTELSRATYLADAAAKHGDRGDVRSDRHYLAMKEILPRLLAAQVRLNDFGGSDFLIGELAAMHGWSPELLYARGAMYQFRGNPRDFVTASQFYRQAIESGLDTPEAHRDLGLALMKSGSTGEGRPELEKYIQMLPDAADAKVIRLLVEQ